jgi:hypothetical protein
MALVGWVLLELSARRKLNENEATRKKVRATKRPKRAEINTNAIEWNYICFCCFSLVFRFFFCFCGFCRLQMLEEKRKAKNTSKLIENLIDNNCKRNEKFFL